MILHTFCSWLMNIEQRSIYIIFIIFFFILSSVVFPKVPRCMRVWLLTCECVSVRAERARVNV